MCKYKLVLMTMVGLSILTARSYAQNTILPVPATTLEIWESSTGKVIVKGTTPIGSVPASAAAVSVVCKEDTIVGAPQKIYGIMVGIKVTGQPDDRTVIDYDELESLLSSIDYLGKIDWSVTSLSSFDASYTTKAGLRLAAFSSKRSGQIEFSIRSSRMVKGILLAPDKLGQLRSLIDQAKTKLDALRNR